MTWLFRSLFRRAHRPARCSDRLRPGLERLEDRSVPAGNLLVTVAGPYPQHLFREYTPAGTLVRSVNIPPTPGSTFDYARDLVEDPSGNVYVYNGTFTPYLATYNPATASWSQTTSSGWSTVSNVSYGGLGLYHNFVYATDMATAGAMPNGIVRFDTVAGTATRLVSGIDFTDLNVGLDGNLYALSGSTVYSFDPVSGAALGKVILPSADYRGISVNAAGDIFTAAWNNVISHFTPTGTLVSSVTLNSSTGAPFMFGNPDDIDVAADGTIAVGSWSGHIVQMTSAFTNISYIDTGTNNTVFVTFANTAGPPPAPSLSVNDALVQNVTSGTTSVLFTVSLSSPSSVPVTADFTTTPGTAAANTDFYPVSGTVTFAPGQTSQTVAVPVVGDPSYDAPETFTFNLSNPNGAPLGRAQGTATIFSAVLPPSLSVGSTTVVNVASGTTSAVFTVSLSAPRPRDHDGQLPDQQRQRLGPERLHADQRYPDVRPRADHPDRRCSRPGRQPLRHPRDLPPEPVQPGQRHGGRGPGDRHDPERRPGSLPRGRGHFGHQPHHRVNVCYLHREPVGPQQRNHHRELRHGRRQRGRRQRLLFHLRHPDDRRGTNQRDGDRPRQRRLPARPQRNLHP
jgi:hypothetical protein